MSPCPQSTHCVSASKQSAGKAKDKPGLSRGGIGAESSVMVMVCCDFCEYCVGTSLHVNLIRPPWVYSIKPM